MPSAPRGNTRANYGRPASKALSTQEWDDLFDGEPHLVDMGNLIFGGSVADFRSAVYRQAEKRNGYATTRRTEAIVIEVRALNGIPLKRLAPAPAPDPTATDRDFDPDADLTEADEEALLGPCTCGQAPTCLPLCARAGG